MMCPNCGFSIYDKDYERGQHPNSRANLRRGSPPKPVPPDIQAQIVLFYARMNLEEMRLHFHITKARIRRVLIANGIPLRGKGVTIRADHRVV